MAARPAWGQQPTSPPRVAGTGTRGGAGGEPAGAVLLGILPQELEPVAQTVTQVGQILPGAQFCGVQRGSVRPGRARGQSPGALHPAHLVCCRRQGCAGSGRGTAPRIAPSAACWPGTPAAPACTAGRQRDVGGRTRGTGPRPRGGCRRPYRRAVGVAVGAADGSHRGGVAGLAAPVRLGAQRLDPARGERLLSARLGPPFARRRSAPAPPRSYLCSSFLRLMHMARW